MSVSLEEILTYLMLIIVGYFVAKMFSRTCNGFSVGGSEVYLDCPPLSIDDSVGEQMKDCYGTPGCKFHRRDWPFWNKCELEDNLSCSDVSSEYAGWENWTFAHDIHDKGGICEKFGETNHIRFTPEKPSWWASSSPNPNSIRYDRCEYNEANNMCEAKKCPKGGEYCFKNIDNYCHSPCETGLLRDDGPGGSCNCLPECCFDEDKDNLEDCRRGNINCSPPPPAPLTEDIFV